MERAPSTAVKKDSGFEDGTQERRMSRSCFIHFRRSAKNKIHARDPISYQVARMTKRLSSFHTPRTDEEEVDVAAGLLQAASTRPEEEDAVWRERANEPVNELRPNKCGGRKIIGWHRGGHELGRGYLHVTRL